MKIALIGYGKMGHAIEEIARARGHEICCIIDVDNPGDFDSEAFRSADVAIEFTTPHTALDATFFWTSNFSLGVNIFFALNRYLASLMESFDAYTPEMKEIHHVHKLDHPSGTAISLAEGIMDCDSRIKGWNEEPGNPDELTISHERIGEVPGTHIIRWDSDVDSITITHEAKSRRGFALGAVVAAEWVAGQHGFLTMDMLMHRLIGNPRLLDLSK